MALIALDPWHNSHPLQLVNRIVVDAVTVLRREMGILREPFKSPTREFFPEYPLHSFLPTIPRPFAGRHLGDIMRQPKGGLVCSARPSVQPSADLDV